MILQFDFFDFWVLNDMRKFIGKNSVILDIGANIGNHCRFFMRFAILKSLRF
jgi:hypothetical protein